MDAVTKLVLWGSEGQAGEQSIESIFSMMVLSTLGAEQLAIDVVKGPLTLDREQAEKLATFVRDWLDRPKESIDLRLSG